MNIEKIVLEIFPDIEKQHVILSKEALIRFTQIIRLKTKNEILEKFGKKSEEYSQHGEFKKFQGLSKAVDIIIELLKDE